MAAPSRFLTQPIEPFRVEPGLTAAEILSRMERISFQGRNLSAALCAWQKMLADDVLINQASARPCAQLDLSGRVLLIGGQPASNAYGGPA